MSRQAASSLASPGFAEPVGAAQSTQQRAAVRKGSWILFTIFLLTLPLANPWVRGDGVGYYAYIRAALIEHNLDFSKDWQMANASFRDGRVDAQGQVRADQYTGTGHIDNHFTVGPAILWAPFMALAHVAVLAADHAGLAIPPDGFSRPYRAAMALASALFGFLAIFLAYRLACRYVDERWAFLAALGIWFASSLPVYMYFNPAWSHAPSAFVVALFVWYWDRTRGQRTLAQWLALGAIAGLMMDVYYPNAILLLLPLIELLDLSRRAHFAAPQLVKLAAKGLAFAAAAVLALLPTLLTRKIVYGSFLNFGYTERWFWNSPALLKVGFSSDHGLFTWTPILLLAAAGLFVLRRYDRLLGFALPAVFLAYLYVIGCYQNWDGLSSFGNRFFVSLTVLFVLGLAVLLDRFARWRPVHRHALAWAAAAIAALILWNAALIFQWGTLMIPARGPVAWGQVIHNQYAAAPGQFAGEVDAYVLHRGALMRQIDLRDLGQVKSAAP